MSEYKTHWEEKSIKLIFYRFDARLIIEEYFAPHDDWQLV